VEIQPASDKALWRINVLIDTAAAAAWIWQTKKLQGYRKGTLYMIRARTGATVENTIQLLSFSAKINRFSDTFSKSEESPNASAVFLLRGKTEGVYCATHIFIMKC